jgi:hypothetical protein
MHRPQRIGGRIGIRRSKGPRVQKDSTFCHPSASSALAVKQWKDSGFFEFPQLRFLDFLAGSNLAGSNWDWEVLRHIRLNNKGL